MGEGRGREGEEVGEGRGREGEEAEEGFILLSLQVKESCGLLTPLLTAVCLSMWLPTVHKVVESGEGERKGERYGGV